MIDTDKLTSEIFNSLKEKVVVLYMMNNNKILGEIYSISSVGLVLSNPVIINFNQNIHAIYMEDLFGGIALNELSMFPTSSIINFNLVIPYIETYYRKYIQELKETRLSFLSEHDSITNTTIH
jgi:hypothetical protein